MCKQRVWNHHRQREIPHVHEDANIQMNRNTNDHGIFPSLFPVNDNWKGELKKHNNVSYDYRNEIGHNLSNATNSFIAEPITHESLINGFTRQPLQTRDFVNGSVEIN